MAIGLAMTFDGVGKEQYEAVMAAGELDLGSPGNKSAGGRWPEGIIAHYAGTTPTGWCVVDIWESQEAFDAFFASQLGPTLQHVGLPQPNLTTFDLYNSHT